MLDLSSDESRAPDVIVDHRFRDVSANYRPNSSNHFTGSGRVHLKVTLKKSRAEGTHQLLGDDLDCFDGNGAVRHSNYCQRSVRFPQPARPRNVPPDAWRAAYARLSISMPYVRLIAAKR
jgi:hypothetical protein